MYTFGPGQKCLSFTNRISDYLPGAVVGHGPAAFTFNHPKITPSGYCIQPVPMRVLGGPAERQHRLMFQEYQCIRSNVRDPFIVQTPLEPPGYLVVHQWKREYDARQSRTRTRQVRH